MPWQAGNTSSHHGPFAQYHAYASRLLPAYLHPTTELAAATLACQLLYFSLIDMWPACWAGNSCLGALLMPANHIKLSHSGLGLWHLAML